MPLNEESKKHATVRLQAIVEEFNKTFQLWMEDTGCRATFGWMYGADKSIKQIEIQAIDAIVYRKPPPSFQSIHDAMEKGAPKV